MHRQAHKQVITSVRKVGLQYMPVRRFIYIIFQCIDRHTIRSYLQLGRWVYRVRQLGGWIFNIFQCIHREEYEWVISSVKKVGLQSMSVRRLNSIIFQCIDKHTNRSYLQLGRWVYSLCQLGSENSIDSNVC